VEEKQMLYVVMEKGETDLSRLIKKISKTNQIHIITILYYWVEILRAVKNIHENGKLISTQQYVLELIPTAL
jgi:serine/threonine protein kinase